MSRTSDERRATTRNLKDDRDEIVADVLLARHLLRLVLVKEQQRADVEHDAKVVPLGEDRVRARGVHLGVEIGRVTLSGPERQSSDNERHKNKQTCANTDRPAEQRNTIAEQFEEAFEARGRLSRQSRRCQQRERQTSDRTSAYVAVGEHVLLLGLAGFAIDDAEFVVPILHHVFKDEQTLADAR